VKKSPVFVTYYCIKKMPTKENWSFFASRCTNISVSTWEWNCYIVDNAVANAKVRMQKWRGQAPVGKSAGARALPAQPLPTPMTITPTLTRGKCPGSKGPFTVLSRAGLSSDWSTAQRRLQRQRRDAIWCDFCVAMQRFDEMQLNTIRPLSSTQLALIRSITELRLYNYATSCAKAVPRNFSRELIFGQRMFFRYSSSRIPLTTHFICFTGATSPVIV